MNLYCACPGKTEPAPPLQQDTTVSQTQPPVSRQDTIFWGVGAKTHPALSVFLSVIPECAAADRGHRSSNEHAAHGDNEALHGVPSHGYGVRRVAAGAVRSVRSCKVVRIA